MMISTASLSRAGTQTGCSWKPSGLVPPALKPPMALSDGYSGSPPPPEGLRAFTNWIRAVVLIQIRFGFRLRLAAIVLLNASPRDVSLHVEGASTFHDR